MMGQTYTNYSLPEFAFLDANSHQGNLLDNRTVIQHIRSYTIVEVISLAELSQYDFSGSQTRQFEFVNFAGVIEQHMLILHFTLAEESQLSEIFTKIAEWYWDYLTWEDDNIRSSEHP